MRVVICGGGAIGACTAYFLSLRGLRPIVVERAGVAGAASGKSGGFLALDWCDGTPLEPLARRSFALHAALPEAIGGDWGYRRLTTYAGALDLGRSGRGAGGAGLPWLSDRVAGTQRLGTPETTAQVHPARFTESLMQAAEARGAELRIGTVTGLALDRDGSRVEGVAVDGETIPCDAVVIAMGPWSRLASQWLPLPPVHGLKGHSLVFDTGGALPPEAVFLEVRDEEGRASSPEVFPRPDGTTYVCAISSDSPVPMNPAEVVPDAGAIERLEALCARVSPVLAQSPILARQACFRPVTRTGLPLIGRVPGIAGAYAATGHSVWGILNAPATGEALAELVTEGRPQSVDLDPFEAGLRGAARA
ncbi:MAG TPA: FAD-dependent oxidoreductase [Microvirga sp.]|jgi:glycine/D-amino acid oxidase-like deaminating enzyme|nr:FAD-dependent oxidoreductase [Microvirga sp.]